MEQDQKPVRFTLGTFATIAEAEKMLFIANLLSETNKSVLRASCIILDSPHYSNEAGVSDYALGVMAEQEVTLQDIKDITAVIAEMKEIEGMTGNN